VILAGNHDAYDNIFPSDWRDRLREQFGEAGDQVLWTYKRAFKRAPVAYYNTYYNLIAMHAFIPIKEEDWPFDKWKKAESRSLVTKQLLWNDPNFIIKGFEFSERDDWVYDVGMDITKKFMEFHKLKYIIRSHEPRINNIFDVSEDKKACKYRFFCSLRSTRLL